MYRNQKSLAQMYLNEKCNKNIQEVLIGFN